MNYELESLASTVESLGRRCVMSGPTVTFDGFHPTRNRTGKLILDFINFIAFSLNCWFPL